MHAFNSVIRGFSWSSGVRIGATLLAALKMSILARLLDPVDFGVFALITVGLGISEAATETGINTTLLQTKRDLREFISTAWVIAIVRGFVIALLMLLVAVGLARWYAEDGLIELMLIATAVPIIKGFIHPKIVRFRKNLEFGKDAIYRAIVVFFEVVVTIILAIIWPSVTALIGGLIAGAITDLCITFAVNRSFPGLSFNRARALEIKESARSLLPNSFLSYVSENLDDVIFGKLTSTDALGFYRNAYVLSHKPNSELGKSMGQGALPVYTQLINASQKQTADQSTTALYRETILKGVGLFTLFSLPLFLMPELLVRILLGEQWLQIVPALPFLGVAGILHTIAHMTHPFLIAAKKYEGVLVQQTTTVLIMVLGFIALVTPYGLIGAGSSLVAARLVGAAILFWYVKFKPESSATG